jgi:putative transcriptional regulator
MVVHHKQQSQSSDFRKREIRLLLERVKNILGKNYYCYEIINYPSSYRERSIDVVAVKDKDKLLLRIRLSIKNLHKDEINDLINAASAIDAVPLVLSDDVIYDNVVCERDNIYLVSDKTLNNILRRSSDVFIIHKKNNFFVRINSKKLEKIKEDMGLSLGDLASYAGVSRRAVFDYLRSDSNVSLEVAERLIELLGEDIIEPVTIESLKTSFTKVVPEGSVRYEKKLLDVLGVDDDEVLIYKINRSAPDYVVVSKDSYEISFVVGGDLGKLSVKDLVKKILETEKLVRVIPSDIKAVIDRSLRDVILDELSVHKLDLNRILVLESR